MTDIRAVFIGEKMISDYALDTGALQADPGLETAVVISFFTDRRAEPDDVLPDGTSDRRGWWGDVAPPIVNGRAVDGDRIGSRFWLLGREKQLQSVLVRAKQYGEECVQWMIEDGLCERIEIFSEIVKTGWLGVRAIIYEPNKDPVTFRFQFAWSAQAERSN